MDNLPTAYLTQPHELLDEEEEQLRNDLTNFQLDGLTDLSDTTLNQYKSNNDRKRHNFDPSSDTQ